MNRERQREISFVLMHSDESLSCVVAKRKEKKKKKKIFIGQLGFGFSMINAMQNCQLESSQFIIIPFPFILRVPKSKPYVMLIILLL